MKQVDVPLIQSEAKVFGFDSVKLIEQLKEEVKGDGFGRTSHGKYQGQVNSFNTNGDLVSTINYDKGECNGPFVLYNVDGTIRCQGNYESERVTLISYFDEDVMYTWSEKAVEGYNYSAKYITENTLYRFNEKDTLADGPGLLIEGDRKSDIKFKNGKIVVSRTWPWSCVITAGVVILGLVAMDIKYFFSYYVF